MIELAEQPPPEKKPKDPVQEVADGAAHVASRAAEATEKAAEKAVPVAREVGHGVVELTKKGVGALEHAAQDAAKHDTPDAPATDRMVGLAGKGVAKSIEVGREVAHAAAPVAKGVVKGLGGIAKKGLEKTKGLAKKEEEEKGSE